MINIGIDLATGEKSYLCPEGSYIPVTDSVINLQDIYKHCPEGKNMITINICQVTGCNEIVHAKGICHKHYLQVQKHGRLFERTRYDLNEISIDGDIAYIQLYNKKNEPVAKAIIDKEDVEKVKNQRWGKHNKGYVNNPDKVLLHRLIIDAKDGDIIDHINQDKLDNRKTNLRFVSLSENNFNSKLPYNNTSGVKGVNYHRQSGKWEASIRINGIKHTKLFTNLNDATAFRKQLEHNEPTFFCGKKIDKYYTFT